MEHVKLNLRDSVAVEVSFLCTCFFRSLVLVGKSIRPSVNRHDIREELSLPLRDTSKTCSRVVLMSATLVGALM